MADPIALELAGNFYTLYLEGDPKAENIFGVPLPKSIGFFVGSGTIWDRTNGGSSGVIHPLRFRTTFMNPIERGQFLALRHFNGTQGQGYSYADLVRLAQSHEPRKYLIDCLSAAALAKLETLREAERARKDGHANRVLTPLLVFEPISGEVLRSWLATLPSSTPLAESDE